MEKKKETSATSPSIDKKELIENLQEVGKFYFLSNKYREAIKEFEKVTKLDPSNADAYYNLGLCYESLNELSLAREMYERVLSIDPNYKLAKEHLERILKI
jgi:tetratricopeptide (TPR) repeat protein